MHKTKIIGSQKKSITLNYDYQNFKNLIDSNLTNEIFFYFNVYIYLNIKHLDVGIYMVSY